MEIKPTYITFEQATKLSELKADLCSNRNQWLLAEDKGNMSKAFICDDDELESYTQIDEDTEHNVYHCLSIPEQWQVVEFLRVNYDVWIEIHHIKTFGVNRFHIIIWKYGEEDYHTIHCDNGVGYKVWDSPQEAISAAFDYILNNLI